MPMLLSLFGPARELALEHGEHVLCIEQIGDDLVLMRRSRGGRKPALFHVF